MSSADSIAWGELVGRTLHPLRVSILEAMAYIDRPLSAKELRDVFDGSFHLSVVSYHLKTLAEIEAVVKVGEEHVRGATKTFYRLTPDLTAPSCRSVRLSSEHRAVVREYLLIHLGGLESLWVALAIEDHERASRLAVTYSDELRLLAGDLGWSSEASTDGELRGSPGVLHRVFARLRLERERVQEELLRGTDGDSTVGPLLDEACDRVLAQLEEPGGADA